MYGCGIDWGAKAWGALPAGKGAVRVKRITPIRIISFCLVGASAALCQSGHTANRGHHSTQPKAASSQRPQHGTARPLPDAPSAHISKPADQFKTVSNEAALPLLTLATGPAAASAAVVRNTNPGIVLPEAPSATLFYEPIAAPNKADAFLSKYLNPSSLEHTLRYQPSSRDKLMERATDAASRVFILRDESGKRHLNTPYFLRVVTAVAAGNASRRYRARSSSAPLSDVGSTIGSDAGMNLLHEFGPGIRQMVTSHMPQFVFRLQDRVARQPGPRPAAAIRSR